MCGWPLFAWANRRNREHNRAKSKSKIITSYFPSLSKKEKSQHKRKKQMRQENAENNSAPNKRNIMVKI